MIERKKFVEIELPLINEKVNVLDRPLKDFENKTLIMDLTRKLRGKGVELIFKLKIDKEKVIAKPFRIHIFSFFIRRLIRRGVNYVEDSFNIECKNAILRVKPFLITRKKVHRSVRKALREKAKEEITNYFKEKNYEEIFSQLLQDKFQKELSKKLKKIYPLSFCDIRDIYVIKEK